MMSNLREIVKKINIEGKILFSEPMAGRTSFKIGGPSDLFFEPVSVTELALVYRICRENDVPCFILGQGANILVSDKGIRGAVISTGGLNRIEADGQFLHAGAGAAMSDVVREACKRSLTGLEFIYAMPGSVGGSVYMNARCYGISLCEVLDSVTVMDVQGRVEERPVDPREFGYKKTPFQGKNGVIVSASFRLIPGAMESIAGKMERTRKDREDKGHFLYPCAGSVFKNNRDFGRPSGMIIDSLGLKDYTIGRVKIAGYHANIIVNTGGGTARDVYDLIVYIKERVREAYGFELEEEVILAGEWEV